MWITSMTSFFHCLSADWISWVGEKKRGWNSRSVLCVTRQASRICITISQFPKSGKGSFMLNQIKRILLQREPTFTLHLHCAAFCLSYINTCRTWLPRKGAFQNRFSCGKHIAVTRIQDWHLIKIELVGCKGSALTVGPLLIRFPTQITNTTWWLLPTCPTF